MSPRGLTSDLSVARDKKTLPGLLGWLWKAGQGRIPWILRTASRVSRRRGGIERGSSVIVETLMDVRTGAEAAQLRGWTIYQGCERQGMAKLEGQQAKKYSPQIELAVGDVSRMRVAVRFEIGRPRCVSALCSCLSLSLFSCLLFRAVAWSGWSGRVYVL